MKLHRANCNVTQVVFLLFSHSLHIFPFVSPGRAAPLHIHLHPSPIPVCLSAALCFRRITRQRVQCVADADAWRTGKWWSALIEWTSLTDTHRCSNSPQKWCKTEKESENAQVSGVTTVHTGGMHQKILSPS